MYAVNVKRYQYVIPVLYLVFCYKNQSIHIFCVKDYLHNSVALTAVLFTMVSAQ